MFLAGAICLTAAAEDRVDVERSFHLQIMGSTEPLAGAMVTPVGIAGTRDVVTWFSMQERRQKAVRSDSRGKVTLHAPAQLSDGSPVTMIGCLVSHDQHVATFTGASAGEELTTIKLKPGRKIAVSAVDDRTGDRIENGLFVLLSNWKLYDDWRILNNGILMSHGVAFERSHLRIVQLDALQPIRFSSIVDLPADEEARRVLLRDISLRRGVRVEGRLDPAVPRPILNGIVSVLVAADHCDWQDMCDISEDGQFVLGGVPPGEIAQITVLCDDWVSANPTREELVSAGMAESVRRLQASRLYPQVFCVKGEVFRPVIRMEPAASCRVCIVDRGGHPVPGVTVRAAPYQGSYDGRSDIVGDGHSTAVLLQKQRTGRLERHEPEEAKRFGPHHRSARHRVKAVTDEEGVARLSGLPGGPEGSPAMTPIQIQHPDYQVSQREGLGDQGLTRAVLYRGQLAELKIQVEER